MVCCVYGCMQCAWCGVLKFCQGRLHSLTLKEGLVDWGRKGGFKGCCSTTRCGGCTLLFYCSTPRFSWAVWNQQWNGIVEWNTGVSFNCIFGYFPALRIFLKDIVCISNSIIDFPYDFVHDINL